MCLFQKLFPFAIDDAKTIPFVQVCSMLYRIINPFIPNPRQGLSLDTHVMSIDDVTCPIPYLLICRLALYLIRFILALQKIPLISFILSRNITYYSIVDRSHQLNINLTSTPPPPSKALSDMKTLYCSNTTTILLVTYINITQHIPPIIPYQTFFFLFSKSAKFLPINPVYYSSTMTLWSLFAGHVSS